MAKLLQYILMDIKPKIIEKVYRGENQMLAVINDNSKPSLAFMVESFNFKLHIDTMEKLKLVKSNMGVVVDLAIWYSRETEKPFSQILKVGMSSAVKAVRTYRGYYNVEFGEYLKKEVSNAMINFSAYQQL